MSAIDAPGGAGTATVQPMGLLEDAIDVLRAVAAHFQDTDAPLGSAARDVVRRFDALLSPNAETKR
jgi:hypothetical protein